jgi:hypothetical protein
MHSIRMSRGFTLFGAALAAVALTGTVPGVAGAACTPPLDSCLDDFTCYKSWVTKDTPAFTPVSAVSLVDQFETATVTVNRPLMLCAPANKNDEGVVDEETHLLAYLIKKQTPKHIKRGTIRVTNQLEEIRVDTVKPEMLLVPTAKTLTQPGPPPPNPGDHGVDHYKCYRVRVTPGTPLPAQDRKVSMSDQFTSPAKLLTLRKPRHLCLPVDKNGEGIKNPQANLLCYAARRARGEPKHLRREGVFVNNQFGPLRVNTIKEQEFCIPSIKSLSPSGAFLDPGGLF